MLKALSDITQAVAAADSLDRALTLLVKQICKVMKVHACSVYLLKDSHLVLQATKGLSTKAIGQVRFPVSEGVIGLAVQREELINIADVQSHPKFKYHALLNEDKYSSLLVAPITYLKQVIGVIVVQQQEKRKFTEDEEAFLMTLAVQLAMVIYNLQRRVRQKLIKGARPLYHGVGISRGIAIAQGLVLGGEIDIYQQEQKAKNISEQQKRLEQALSRSRHNLINLIQKLDDELDDEVGNILSSLLQLLDTKSLAGEFFVEIKKGWRAETAVSLVVLRYIQEFSAMDDPYLREKAKDIRELGQRVLRQLIEPDKLQINSDIPVILITREADTELLAEFPREKLAGIVTESGSVNSHAAIVARAMGVPVLTGIERVQELNLDGKLLILNATLGQLLINPNKLVINEYRQLIAFESELQQGFKKELSQSSLTQDGCLIELHINAGLPISLDENVAHRADGIGLYRSETPFLLRQRFPSENEQIKAYQQILNLADDKPVVMRTLDIGGDKQLPYLAIKEDNPSLGWRGIRFSLNHPELFLIQLRAMLRAGRAANHLSILFPMVSSILELDQAIGYLNQAVSELSAESNTQLIKPKIGVMLEVPALMFQISELAKRVDFVSVGSNDLTQYLLAVDRNNPKVNGLFNSYHPGVLSVLKQICHECDHLNLPVSVCGELAGEAVGALLLVAMGYRKLSMNQNSLPHINYLLRRINIDELAYLLALSLQQANGQDVQQLVYEYFINNNLSELVDM